mgnify:CR=1 FL=1
MTAIPRAYEEIIDFFAAGTSPQEVADFQASEETRRRVNDLIEKEKTTGLTELETEELEYFLVLEHLMRLAKARAKQHLRA